MDINKILDSVKAVEVSQSGAVTANDVDTRLIAGVAEHYKISQEQAFTGVALLCQQGGTAKRAQGNIYAIIDGIRIELAVIRKLLSDIERNATLRQFARKNGNEIQAIASRWGVVGDLAKKLARRYPTLSREELIWCSNFQMDNSNCPERVRRILMEHYQSEVAANDR